MLYCHTAITSANLGDILEALSEVWLNSSRVLRLRQDLEQLIVGQEVEARKSITLGFQVVAETLLHQFQQLVALSKTIQ